MTFSRTLALLLALLLAGPASAEVRPAKTWFAPTQPLTFANDGNVPLRLVLTTFQGDRIPVGQDVVESDSILPAGEAVDLTSVYPSIRVGTYLLYPTDPETPQNLATAQFASTPYVISVLGDNRVGAAPGPTAVKVEPLQYAIVQTDLGAMTLAFYYDGAPHTIGNFLDLAAGGYYDGLTFHRVVPGFVIQGGDPVGDGTGGPGYRIDAEFNERPHLPGVLSMAREGDPIERQGAMPRDAARNSAGSQFFIALDYENTRRLDGRYTVFGRVVQGMNVVRDIAAAPLVDERLGRPEAPVVIEQVEVRRVEPGTANQYEVLVALDAGGAIDAGDVNDLRDLNDAPLPSSRPAEPGRDIAAEGLRD